jgi:hypothetical protein
LEVKKYTSDRFVEIEGNIYLGQNEGDIYEVVKKVISVASREEVMKNEIYSLNGKDYNKKELVVGDGYELVKLGDICEFMKKSKRNASFGQSTGQYNFYTSSDKVQKCDIADYKEECLIIGDGGMANIKLDNNFSCSDHNHIIKTSYNKYIYYLISRRIDLLSNGFKGSVLKNLSKDYLINLQIPIPQSQDKIKEWVDKISAPYEEKNEKQTQIKELETFVRNRIKDIGENEDCDVVELGSVCEFKSGKFNTCNMDNKGVYPFYNATINSIGFHSKYCFDDTKYLLLIKSGNVKANGLGSVIKLYGKNACVTDTVQIKSSLNIDYIYGILTLIKDTIRKTSNNSVGLGHLKISDVKLIKIKIPKNKQLISDLEITFQQIETLQNDVRSAESFCKQYIKELSQEAMPQQFNEMIYNVENDLENEKSQDNTEQNISILNEMNTPINNDGNCDWIMKSGVKKGKRCDKKKCKTHKKTSDEVKTGDEVETNEDVKTTMSIKNKCQGFTKKGQQCSKTVKNGVSKCNLHS